MKRIWCALIGLLPLAGSAAEAQFACTTNAGEITITAYLGASGKVAIPALIAGRPVTRIGDDAFAVCARLTQVTIPDSITSIGNSAFEGTRLASVTLPGSVTNIGSYAFYACRSLTNVMISDSVTRIGHHAFAVCTNLGKIAIPGSVTHLGDFAFYACRNLTNASMAGGLTHIGDWQFSECSRLTSVTIPGSVTNIGKEAFSFCPSLAGVIIPGGVLGLGEGAFRDCGSLAGVYCMGFPPAADLSAFTADARATVYYQPGAAGWSSTFAGLPTAQALYAFTTTGRDITLSAWFGAAGQVDIPASLGGLPVTSIGKGVFANCTNLTQVTIPGSVTNIGNNAFSSCSNLNSVFFNGNAPAVDLTAFGSDAKATVYYQPGATGWSSQLAGLPVVKLNLITIQVLPKSDGAVVSGGGFYPKGWQAVLAASTPDDCHAFTHWSAGSRTVSSNNPYTFTVTGSETLAANFAQLEHTISTSSSPARGGTTGGGGKKDCGTIATLTARVNAGFAFTDWTSSSGVNYTNASFKIPVVSDESFVAHFRDVERPAVRITSPAANAKSGKTAFLIEGSATDNVGLSKVYFNLNQTGWQPASSTNDFKSWFAPVNLALPSTNIVSAYAVDTSGNCSITNGPIKFICF